MHTFDWFLIGWWGLGLILNVAQVGKPRKPIDGLTASIVCLITLCLMAGLLVSHGVIA